MKVVIPKGIIAMWYGASNIIPSGWAICDGNNGTPDLRDKFIVGAGNSYSVNATGGEATHKLTVSEMPSHSHSIKRQTGSWGGTYTAIEASTDTSSIPESLSGAMYETGGGRAHNNLPPYYALCYIMKL